MQIIDWYVNYISRDLGRKDCIVFSVVAWVICGLINYVIFNGFSVVLDAK